SRGPTVALDAIVSASEICVADVTVVELIVIPDPNDAVAPDWKLVPVTVTARLVPCVPTLGEISLIDGIAGSVVVAVAVVPSAKLAVTLNALPVANGVGLRSEANTWKAPPSATPKLTVPLAAFSSEPSTPDEAPSAQ